MTPSLNADLPGTLPVHCIYQLLKSRAFTKHRVPINDWIFRSVPGSPGVWLYYRVGAGLSADKEC